mgnify:FL=1
MILCPHLNELSKPGNFGTFFLNIFIAFLIVCVLCINIFVRPYVMEDKLLGNNVSKLVKSFYEKNNFQFLAVGYLIMMVFFIIAMEIYTKYKKSIPFKYDTVKFIFILTALILILEGIFYGYLNQRKNQANNNKLTRSMVNIVKELSFGKTLLFILLDIVFIVLILLLALSIKKYNLDNKWYSFLIIAVVLLSFLTL